LSKFRLNDPELNIMTKNSDETLRLYIKSLLLAIFIQLSSCMYARERTEAGLP